MSKRLVLLIAILGASQFALGDIESDIISGISPEDALGNAVDICDTPDEIVAQLIEAGVTAESAIDMVGDRCGLCDTPDEIVVQLIEAGVSAKSAVDIVGNRCGLSGDCGLTRIDAISQMRAAGVSMEIADIAVTKRCGLTDVCEDTLAPIDSIIIAALNTLPEDADTAPLVALFPGCSIGALEEPPAPPTPAAAGAGGGAVSPS